MSLCPLLLLCLSSALAMELRCYCNLPACVQTYMCKSSLGCFQELETRPRDRPDRIGCLELWPKKRRFHCVGISRPSPVFEKPTTTPTARKTPTSYLRCCLEDMCNYVPQSEPELSISISKATKTSREQASTLDTRQSPTRVSQQVWFRAAVVAVPICGALILLVLVLSACAMLRSDWRRVEDSDRLLSTPLDAERCFTPTNQKLRRLANQRPAELKHSRSDPLLIYAILIYSASFYHCRFCPTGNLNYLYSRFL